jgi:hypothetical protein
MEAIGTIAGFVVTLMVFGYLLEDVFLFRFAYRLAVYVFVGLAAAFTAIVTIEGVLLPLLSSTREDLILLIIALIFGLLLLLKGIQRLAWISNLVLAFLIAVGAVVALVGAISGTLLPLAAAMGDAGRENLLEGVIIVVGVVTSLWYFNYATRRDPAAPQRPALRLFSTVNLTLRGIGKGFIVITLGALYGAAILTSLTILSERVAYLLSLGG